MASKENPVLRPRQPNSQKPRNARRPVRKSSREEERSRVSNGSNRASQANRLTNNQNTSRTPKKQNRIGNRGDRQSNKVKPKNGSMANGSRKLSNETRQQPKSLSKNSIAKENKAWDESKGASNNTLKNSESSNALNRKDKLAKFKKRNLAGLKTGNDMPGTTVNAAVEPKAPTPTASISKPVPAKTIDPKSSASISNDEDAKAKHAVAFAGTGNVLSSGAKVVSEPKLIAATKPQQIDVGNRNDSNDGEESSESSAFSGEGKILGGTVAKPSAAVPWADLHRQRHQRHMERKRKEEAKREQEAAEKRKQELARFEKIKETLEAEARERQLAEAEKKALLDAQRAALESKVEDKLMRDQLIKKKKEERIARRKQLAQEKADAEMAKKLQEELEGRKSPVAVGSGTAAARKAKRPPKTFK